MDHSLALIQDLGIVLGMAAVMGMVARRLGQPPVLGYLLAGLVVGPYIPIPVFADAGRIHALSELGIVLVMFVVGLELRVKRFLAVLPTAGATALIEVAAVMVAGFAIGTAMGWTTQGAVFLGASICISSTMIVSNVFAGQEVAAPLRRYVMSVLVIQDVLAIVLAAVLTAVAAGQGLGALDLGLVVGRLGGELVAAVIVGIFVVPWLIRRVLATGSRELLVVVCAGLCFALAYGAESLGYSVALGAFLAGVLVAESGGAHDVEDAMAPVRDLFAAVFFVSIGMTVDPRMALENAPASLAVFAAVLVVQLVSVSLAGLLSGNGLRRSVRAGLTLGQVGEFGFILSAIGIEAGVAPKSLAPIVVTVAVLTSFTTPLAIRFSEAIVQRLEGILPVRLQVLLSLYAAWLERLRLPSPRTTGGRSGWRYLLTLTIEGLALVGLVWVATAAAPSLGSWLEGSSSVPSPWGPWVVRGTSALLAIAPIWGFAMAVRRYSKDLAGRVFGADSATGLPLRALMEPVIQTLLVLAFGLPSAVLVLPVAGPLGAIVVVLCAFIPAALAWRAADGADVQVRTSAQRFLALVSARMGEDGAHAEDPPDASDDDLASVLGAVPFSLDAASPASGRTLAQLDLRAKTGTSVVAIRSSTGAPRLPMPNEPLAAGDTLMLAGPADALEAARELLLSA